MTVIGTPYADDATRVLLLGSGELGKEVAIAFQRLAFRPGVKIAQIPTRQVANIRQRFTRLVHVGAPRPWMESAIIAGGRPLGQSLSGRIHRPAWCGAPSRFIMPGFGKPKGEIQG